MTRSNYNHLYRYLAYLVAASTALFQLFQGMEDTNQWKARASTYSTGGFRGASSDELLIRTSADEVVSSPTKHNDNGNTKPSDGTGSSPTTPLQPASVNEETSSHTPDPSEKKSTDTTGSLRQKNSKDETTELPPNDEDANPSEKKSGDAAVPLSPEPSEKKSTDTTGSLPQKNSKDGTTELPPNDEDANPSEKKSADSTVPLSESKLSSTVPAKDNNDSGYTFKITMDAIASSNGGNVDGRFSLKPLDGVSDSMDYGTIEYAQAKERAIKENDNELYENEKAAQYEYYKDDGQEYDFTDIGMESTSHYPCVKPTWSTTVRTTCNRFHEMTLDEFEERPGQHKVDYLGGGANRVVFRYERNSANEEFAVKIQGFDREFRRYRYGALHTEGSVMDQLSASPSISNVYASCGISMAVELASGKGIEDIYWRRSGSDERYGRMAQSELDELIQTNKKVSQNNLSPTKKLDIAIGIAESIAEVHGLPAGPIVVADIHLRQWIMMDQGPESSVRMILNDFDLATPLSWNVQEKEYCEAKYTGGPVAPEKVPESWVGVFESLDVWHVGGALYTVLTGLLPYYNDIKDITTPEVYEPKMEELVAKQKPHFDQALYAGSSFVEGRMHEIIEKCFELDPTKRASIFEVLQHLRETKKQAADSAKDKENEEV